MNKLIQTREQKYWGVVGITGIRTPADVSAHRQHFGDEVLVICARVMKPTMGYGRDQQRSAERDPQTYQQCLKQDKADGEILSLNDTVEWADIVINHDGKLERVRRESEQSRVQDLPADEIDSHSESLSCDGQGTCPAHRLSNHF